MIKGRILVVDDIEINRIILHEILSEDYEVRQAANGIDAISLIFDGSRKPDLILLDLMMPQMSGFEVLEILKSNIETRNIPVIIITASNASDSEYKGLSLGAADYITKPFNPDSVKVRVDNHIELKLYREELERLVDKKANEHIETRDKMLEALATIIEYRNLESGRHVMRTRVLTEIMLDHLLKNPKYENLFSQSDRRIIVKAVSLHDVGKIGIPDRILLKPSPLTTPEFDVMKTHTVIGSEIIDSLIAADDFEYLRHCKDICRYHHERWNGTGYPDGLVGDDIPISARILSVVDVYDALVCKRIYKSPFTHDNAIRIITESSGVQFDPDIVKAVIEVEDKFKAVS